MSFVQVRTGGKHNLPSSSGKFCCLSSFLHLPGVDDNDVLLRLVPGVPGYFLNLLNDVIAFQYLPEDNMFSVKPLGGGGGDEEL